MEAGDSVCIKFAEFEHELSQVHELTHNEYLKKGYITPRKDQKLVHYPLFDASSDTRTLLFIYNGDVAGTISLTFDSLDGLPLDVTFREECNEIRKEGKKVAAVWRLVVNNQFRNAAKIIKYLLHYTISYLRANDVDIFLFAVHPKHAPMYARFVNAQIVSVKALAPGEAIRTSAVLMRADHQLLPSEIRAFSHAFSDIEEYLKEDHLKDFIQKDEQRKAS